MDHDFQPKHSQPFSLAQARQLDVATITAEISRLENSLEYLDRTQKDLKEALAVADEPDRDLQEALDENNGVIASQEERIRMLGIVLEENGVPVSSTRTRPRDNSPPPSQPSSHPRAELVAQQELRPEGAVPDDGVYL